MYYRLNRIARDKIMFLLIYMVANHHDFTISQVSKKLLKKNFDHKQL
jgi:hypothetical protein